MIKQASKQASKSYLAIKREPFHFEGNVVWLGATFNFSLF